MDNISNSDETYDLGYQPSQSSVDQNDHSPIEATRLSMQSGYSFCRTNSDASAFSEPTDDNSSSFSDTPSPLYWPGMKSPKAPVLSRLGMQQHKHVMDDDEAEDLGWSFKIVFFFLSFSP